MSKVRGLDRSHAIQSSLLGSLWKEMRPYQWVKNLFVLPPLIFSPYAFSLLALGRAVAAFTLFCLASSAIYLLNDIKDVQQDRLHPQKRHRPIAAGKLSVNVALAVMLVLLIAALAGGVTLDKTFALILCGYLFINVLYSTWLKHQVILDVFAIASGFVLRVVAGAVVIKVEVSQWLLLCTTLLALFIGFSKRRQELVSLGDKADCHRLVLNSYSYRFLDMMIGVVAPLAVMSYTLYTVSETTVQRFHTHGLFSTVPFVLYGVFRYLYLVYHKEEGGDPTQSLLTDRPMALNLCLWTLTVVLILYWP